MLSCVAVKAIVSGFVVFVDSDLQLIFAQRGAVAETLNNREYRHWLHFARCTTVCIK